MEYESAHFATGDNNIEDNVDDNVYVDNAIAHEFSWRKQSSRSFCLVDGGQIILHFTSFNQLGIAHLHLGPVSSAPDQS